MNRRNLLKALILAPLAKLLPKNKPKPTKEIPNIPDDAFSDWTFTCDTCNDSNSISTISLYMPDSEGKWKLVDGPVWVDDNDFSLHSFSFSLTTGMPTLTSANGGEYFDWLGRKEET